MVYLVLSEAAEGVGAGVAGVGTTLLGLRIGLRVSGRVARFAAAGSVGRNSGPGWPQPLTSDAPKRQQANMAACAAAGATPLAGRGVRGAFRMSERMPRHLPDRNLNILKL